MVDAGVVAFDIGAEDELLAVEGALYLKALDDRMAETGLFYARFMDDWVILAPTRWKLRRAIRLVNETLSELKLEQHPDKTFIGRTSRGFDFLGYQFTPSGLAVAAKTIERFTERLTRLYERGALEGRIGDYVRHWRRWVTGGLGARKLDVEAWLQDYLVFGKHCFSLPTCTDLRTLEQTGQAYVGEYERFGLCRQGPGPRHPTFRDAGEEEVLDFRN